MAHAPIHEGHTGQGEMATCFHISYEVMDVVHGVLLFIALMQDMCSLTNNPLPNA